MKLLKVFEKSSSNNATMVALQLLKKLNVSVTYTSAINSIEYHPDFPSLLSISDSLSRWKVDNLALKVSPDKLHELPVPFVAHLKKGSGYFTLVTKVSNEFTYHVSENGKESQQSFNEFIKEWSGVVLLAEVTKKSGEENYDLESKKELIENLRIPIIVAINLLLVALYIFVNVQNGILTSLLPTLLLLLKLSGCFITGLLLWFELDRSNPVLKEICTGGKVTSCEAVLKSKAAKILGWVSWSEIGFFYFSGGFLFLLASVSESTAAFILLSWMNLFVLPYTIFSIIYQWKVAKQWCPLCLSIQALLILEGVISYFGYWNKDLNFQESLILNTFSGFVLFTIPIFFWLYIKPVLSKLQKLNQIEKDQKRLKSNPNVLNALLKKQKRIEIDTNGLGITIGNPKAENTLVKVCNPLCAPCSRSHLIIEEILKRNENVKVQIIFNVASYYDDNIANIVRHFMTLYQGQYSYPIQEVLDKWYNADQKEYSSFALKYQIKEDLALQNDSLDKMYEWCNKMDIGFTPTFFINGYQLPNDYRLEDLKYMLQ
jgi:uncharacterized membrane protein